MAFPNLSEVVTTTSRRGRSPTIVEGCRTENRPGIIHPCLQALSQLPNTVKTQHASNTPRRIIDKKAVRLPSCAVKLRREAGRHVATGLTGGHPQEAHPPPMTHGRARLAAYITSIDESRGSLSTRCSRRRSARGTRPHHAPRGRRFALDLAIREGKFGLAATSRAGTRHGHRARVPPRPAAGERSHPSDASRELLLPLFEARAMAVKGRTNE
jgi:hypothetical protein